MSREQPFRIEQDGYVCRVTMDAHYVSDDDMQRIADTFNQLRRENDELRELARDAYATLLFYVGKYNEAEASLCAEYGEDDAIAKLDRECDNDVMLLERRMKLMGIEVKQ